MRTRSQGHRRAGAQRAGWRGPLERRRVYMDVLARPEYQIVGPPRCSRWCLLKFIAHTSRGETPARAPFPCGQIARRSDKCLVLSVTVYPDTLVPRNRNQEGPFCNIRRFATAKISRFSGFETRSCDPGSVRGHRIL